MNDRHDMSAAQDRKRHAFLMEHGLGSFYKLAPDHVGHITGATMEKLVNLAIAAEPEQPVALSALTDEQIEASAAHHNGEFDDGVWMFPRADFYRLARAFATSAPAQQAAPVPEQNDAECWVCGRPMDGKSEDDCHCFHRKELSPEQICDSLVYELTGYRPEQLSERDAAIIRERGKARWNQLSVIAKANLAAPTEPLPPVALAAARKFGAGLDSQSLEQAEAP